MKRAVALLLLACSTAACGTDLAGPGAQLSASPLCSRPAPLYGQPDAGVPDQYIVVFNDGVDAAQTARALAARYGFQTRFVYEHALLGFSAVMNSAAVAGVRCEPSVKYVAHDAVITIDD